MTTERLGSLQEEPRAVRPPFDVRDDRNPLYRRSGPTDDEWRP